MLHEQIKNGIKEAMLTKDALKLKAFRAMSAAFTNELVAKNRKPQEFLKDEEAIAVITKLAKQRKDSIEQFKRGNREGVVKKKKKQNPGFWKFIPKQTKTLNKKKKKGKRGDLEKKKRAGPGFLETFPPKPGGSFFFFLTKPSR